MTDAGRPPPPPVSTVSPLMVRVRAFPYRSPYPDGGPPLWFLYDVLIVAEDRWTGPLDRRSAQVMIERAGLNGRQTTRALLLARRRVKAAIDDGTWRGAIPPFPPYDVIDRIRRRTGTAPRP